MLSLFALSRLPHILFREIHYVTILFLAVPIFQLAKGVRKGLSSDLAELLKLFALTYVTYTLAARLTLWVIWLLSHRIEVENPPELPGFDLFFMVGGILLLKWVRNPVWIPLIGLAAFGVAWAAPAAVLDQPSGNFAALALGGLVFSIAGYFTYPNRFGEMVMWGLVNFVFLLIVGLNILDWNFTTYELSPFHMLWRVPLLIYLSAFLLWPEREDRQHLLFRNKVNIVQKLHKNQAIPLREKIELVSSVKPGVALMVDEYDMEMVNSTRDFIAHFKQEHKMNPAEAAQFYCLNCFRKFEPIGSTQYRMAVCPQCGTVDHFQSGVMQVNGRIGGQKAVEMVGDTLWIRIWNPWSKESQFAEIDVLYIKEGGNFNYDWAISDFLEDWLERPELAERKFTLMLEGNPPLGENSRRLLKQLVTNPEVL